MLSKQELIDKIAELEQRFDRRPSATMDPFFEERKLAINEISDLRSQLHTIAYEGKPTPMMMTQMNASGIENDSA